MEAAEENITALPLSPLRFFLTSTIYRLSVDSVDYAALRCNVVQHAYLLCTTAVPTFRRFLGDMEMNLWDCGGQDSFYESYFNHQQDFIFRSVEVSR